MIGADVRLAGKREHARIDFLEARKQCIDIPGSTDRRARRGHLDILELAVIADIGHWLDLDRFLPEALADEFLDEFAAQLIPDIRHRLHGSDAFRTAHAGRHHHRNASVATMGVVHAGAAPGGEPPRPRDGDDRLVGMIARVRQEVQRPAAAVAEQHVVAQIAADHETAHEVLAHLDVQQIDADLAGVVDVEPQRIGDLFLEQPVRRLLVDLDLAAKIVVLVQDAEQEVRVVDGRRRVAGLHERRTRRATGRVRAELDAIGGRVDADVGARARADRGDAQHRGGQVHVLEARLAIDRHGTRGDAAGIERRAADVGADDVLLADHAAEIPRPHQAADRPRHRGLEQTRIADVGHAAVAEDGL